MLFFCSRDGLHCSALTGAFLIFHTKCWKQDLGWIFTDFDSRLSSPPSAPNLSNRHVVLPEEFVEGRYDDDGMRSLVVCFFQVPYPHIVVVVHGGRFPCSFFLSSHYPAERERARKGATRKCIPRSQRLCSIPGCWSEARPPATSERGPCLADQLVDGQYKYDQLDTKLCGTRIIIPQKAWRCIVRLCRHNKTVSELSSALSYTWILG